MNTINLSTIFCYLANDQHLLQTTLKECVPTAELPSSTSCTLMNNMVSEYVPLYPYETQPYSLLPLKVKYFLTPDYVRYGVKNTIEQNLNIINISFINSLNSLIRPEILTMNSEDQIKNLILFKDYICHAISRNCQIDKIKYTQKIQAINKNLIQNLNCGEMNDQLIQYIINIFEINLLVFDLSKSEIHFYWARSLKYPTLNTFKDIYSMCLVQGDYEPISCFPNALSEDKRNEIYAKILTSNEDIICHYAVQLSYLSYLHIDTWRINNDLYSKILTKYFNKNLFEYAEESS